MTRRVWIKDRRISVSCRPVERHTSRPSAPLFAILSFFEAKIDANLWVKIAVHLRIKGRSKAFKSEAGSAAHMQVGVPRTLTAIDHEDLHLADGQVFDMFFPSP